MSTLFSAYRWFTFCLLIVCNAIICSIAAWNMSFIYVRDSSVAVDTYMIFISALSLVFTFTIIFVDVSRRNAVSSRVWFELGWVALFWVLEFSGAVATSSVLPPQLCILQVTRLDSLPCTSSKVLLSFAWICTIALFVYGLTLAVLAWMHQSRDSSVWYASVGQYPWFLTRQSLSSAPTTPVMMRYNGNASSIVAPKPRRPPPIFVQRRGTMSTKYEIERYPSDEMEEVALPPPALPPQAKVMPAAMSLYPAYIVQNMPNAMPGNVAQMGPSPPPLGNWPRRMSSQGQSTNRSHSKQKGKRRANPSNVTAQPLQRLPEPAPERIVVASSVVAAELPQNQANERARPSGPRTKGNSSFSSKPRPPPLDLSPERMRAGRAMR